MVLMTDTPNLALPYILAAQAQKHVTHNEAIRALDCLVQLSAVSRSLTAPPATPDEGSRYIVASAATGDWTGEETKVAAYQDGAWAFYTPKDGWLAWVMSENVLVVYEGSGWAALPSGGGGGGGGVTDHGMLTGLADDDHLQYHTDARGDARYLPIDPATLGINATADTTNRLALKSPASLFDNEGNGHQQKINKHASSDTASVLYQTNYSGRAEMGLTGDDDFHFKVSPDGSTWYDAIKIDRITGKVSCAKGGPTVQVFTSSGTWTKPAGCVRIKATIIGGGGGGGGAGSSSSGAGGSSGGSSGGACISFVGVTAISSLPVTVGAGGPGGSAGANDGSPGGASGLGTANAYGQATGGGAGVGDTAKPLGTAICSSPSGAAGVGSGGTINIAGNAGSYGMRGTSTRCAGGAGGSSYLGGSGVGASASAEAADGGSGSQGGGGGGGATSQTTTSAAGGAGGGGIVIIEEYYA